MRTGMSSPAGKEDPVELDSDLMLWGNLIGVGYEEGFSTLEYLNGHNYFSQNMPVLLSQMVWGSHVVTGGRV